MKVLGPELNLKNPLKNTESYSVILLKHVLLVDAVSNLPRFKEGRLIPHFWGVGLGAVWKSLLLT